MRDKRKVYKPGYLKSSVLPEDYLSEFKSVTWEMSPCTYEINTDAAVIGYLVTEHLGTICQLHIFIKPEYRTKRVLLRCRQLYTDDVIPMLKDQGVTKIIVTGSDDRTRRLMEFMGFAPEKFYLGIQEI